MFIGTYFLPSARGTIEQLIRAPFAWQDTRATDRGQRTYDADLGLMRVYSISGLQVPVPITDIATHVIQTWLVGLLLSNSKCAVSWSWRHIVQPDLRNMAIRKRDHVVPVIHLLLEIARNYHSGIPLPYGFW
jgi:hypothetical protein